MGLDYSNLSMQALQARVKELQAAGVIADGVIQSLQEENARLRKVVDAVRPARWHPRSPVATALRELDGATTNVSSK